jgi:hypothetical protein
LKAGEVREVAVGRSSSRVASSVERMGRVLGQPEGVAT